ncbi:uncharacterized protein J3D65DRAFT_623888 [Phyllosticta citribraziliensis]|uniref:Uncharacterized protein n=1 Tax=Phyllosticta citribraziliensis TaxID=989973 RepID=A0ABR1LP48_9PEZI
MPGSTTSKLSIIKPKPVVKCGEECDCCGCEEACWCVARGLWPLTTTNRQTIDLGMRRWASL